MNVTPSTHTEASLIQASHLEVIGSCNGSNLASFPNLKLGGFATINTCTKEVCVRASRACVRVCVCVQRVCAPGLGQCGSCHGAGRAGRQQAVVLQGHAAHMTRAIVLCIANPIGMQAQPVITAPHC